VEPLQFYDKTLPIHSSVPGDGSQQDRQLTDGKGQAKDGTVGIPEDVEREVCKRQLRTILSQNIPIPQRVPY